VGAAILAGGVLARAWRRRLRAAPDVAALEPMRNPWLE